MNKPSGCALALASACFVQILFASGNTGSALRVEAFETAKGIRPEMTRIESPVLTPITDEFRKEPRKWDVFVDADKRFQEVVGIGGAMSDAAAWTLMQMDEPVREEVLRRYFKPEGGAGYSLVRVPMNACDFARRTYSCCDTPDDFELKTFNLDHDRECMIPMLKRALELQPGLKIYLSPWSAPAWMKTNGDMCNGGKLKPECRKVWAEFYCRFIEEYAKEGIPIWGLTIQNEMFGTAPWESMVWTAEEQRDFIRDFLGPALVRHGLSEVKVILWDYGRDYAYPVAKAVYDDPEAAKYVWGLGFHWYNANKYDNIRILHDVWPDKHLILTEACNGGNNYVDPEWGNADKPHPQGLNLHEGVWEGGERYGRNMIRDFNRWTEAWTDWNMVVDQTGGPRHLPRGCGAPFVYDTKTKELRPQIAYQYIRHFTDFVKAGARRVAVTTGLDKVEATAFANPDGTLVTVIMNAGDAPRKVLFHAAGLQGEFELAARSIRTIVIHEQRQIRR